MTIAHTSLGTSSGCVHTIPVRSSEFRETMSNCKQPSTIPNRVLRDRLMADWMETDEIKGPIVDELGGWTRNGMNTRSSSIFSPMHRALFQKESKEYVVQITRPMVRTAIQLLDGRDQEIRKRTDARVRPH